MPNATNSNNVSEAKVLVLGGTGLIGSTFLKEAEDSSFISKTLTISRRRIPLFDSLEKLTCIVEPNSERWVEIIEKMESFDLVFSALGTTKHNLNESETQKQVDHELNLRLAGAAKAKGAKVLIMVTSFNNPYLTLSIPYFALKKEIEDGVTKLIFQRTIFLRPGPLVGDRSALNTKQSFSSVLSSVIARLTYDTPCSQGLGFPIRAEEVAEAAVFLLETNLHLDEVKFVSSREMFDLAHALEGI